MGLRFFEFAKENMLAILIGMLIGALAGRGCCPGCPETAQTVKIRPTSIAATVDSSLNIMPKAPVKIAATGKKKGAIAAHKGDKSSTPVSASRAELPPTIDSEFVSVLDTIQNGVVIHAEYSHPQNVFTVDVQCPPDTSRIVEKVITVTQPVEIARVEGATLGEKTMWAGVGAAVMSIIALVFGGQ